MKIYVSKESMYIVAIPEKGELDIRNGKLTPIDSIYTNDGIDKLIEYLEDKSKYRVSFEVKDELIEDLIKKTKTADKIIKQQNRIVCEASEYVIKVISKELDKYDESRWGGKYSVLDITLEKDDPFMNYQDLLDYANNFLCSKSIESKIRDACPPKTWGRIFTHIGYVLKNGSEKEKSIMVLNKFVQENKSKNPKLEEIMSVFL